MVVYRREFKRFRRSIWGALALLLLFSFSLRNVAASAYFSLFMGSSSAVLSPPVELEEGTAGNSTIYANKTSALVSVDSGATGNDVEDYVDNNTSDVDNSTDVGTHSNFTAQQYGPDSINDTLTEENTGGSGSSTLWLHVNADDETKQDWTRVGTNPYLNAIDYSANYTYVFNVTDAGGGDFNFSDSGKSSESIDSVILQVYARQNQTGQVLSVNIYDGASWWGLGNQNVSTSWGWLNYTATTRLDTWTKIDTAKMRLVIEGTPPGMYEVDCAKLKVDYTHVQKYELDLEVQWTNADYDESNEMLCIYGGTMSAEDIRVDVWNGSGWENIVTDLNSGWNNVSVSSYLDSSNFTIRFKGANETSDTTQSTWNIDAVLLHVWAATEVLGNATTVSVEAKIRANSYSTQRAVLRTTDASNTLHVFLLDSTGSLQWYNSTDNGQTWDKSFTSTLSATSFSVEKDSNNNIHLVYDASGNVEYRKQAYNATSWGNATTLDSSGNAHQPSIAVAAYNQSWIYVVFDVHSTSGGKSNEVHFARSTDGGSTWAETSTDITDTLEWKTAFIAGTFPSIVSNNTLGTYGHIYATWFSGNEYLYLRRGVLGSTGGVTWDIDDDVITLSSAMSTASTTINTNMVHSAVDNSGKYRVVYCESGTAKYRDWNESTLSSPISLATVSNYPSLTYDSNNYLYVLYETNASNSNYDIRYQKSTDTTPTSFNNPANITDNNNGNEFVITKIGGDNNRVEFVWTRGTYIPYEVKYNYITEGSGGGQGDFNHVLKAVEKDNSNWKIRLKAYNDFNKDRLNNCTIYIYNGSNSTQIVILNGNYQNQTGPWYDLSALDTEYIWMHVETSGAGTSYVYVYLEILVPNQTTYARYIITFEIN